MHDFLKAVSSMAILALCSACADTDASSSGISKQTELHEPSETPIDERPDKKSDIKAVASDENIEAEIRSAESHTHGDASLGVVLEGSAITMEFETPLYNLLGFEHAAETDAQKAALIKAETALSDGASLFLFNGEANCASSGATPSVELSLEDHDAHDHEGEHHDDHDDHDDHSDHDDHDDHGGEVHDETHKDVTLRYSFECQSPKALKNMSVSLFEYFDNLLEIDLVYLGPNTQKQAQLSPARPSLNLTR